MTRKRGMALAIDIVERMKAISEEYAEEYRLKGPRAADAFRQQVSVYQSVIDQLKRERR